MSLATYDDLKASVADWLLRSDLTSQIPDFIALAEAQFNRLLNTQEMTTTATGSLSDETLALPTGFAGVKSFRLSTSPVTHLEYRTADDMDNLSGASFLASGKPLYYAVEGGTFIFSPVPDGAYDYRLRYRTRVPALSDSNATNWLLTKHPDAYLYGALLQSAPYLVEDQRLGTWAAIFDRVIQDINADERWVTAGAAPAMRGRAFV